MYRITLRILGTFFFLAYALAVPLFASTFFQDHPTTSLLIMACCLILSLLFYSGVAPLFNILLSFYIFKLYLIRPYVDIFLYKLTNLQIDYIAGNNNYFNSEDAITVYANLFFLLFAWLLGLLLLKPKKNISFSYPWVFKKFDSLIFSPNWRFWTVLFILIILNYQDPRAMWKSTIYGGGETLFAYGLLLPGIVYTVLLVSFMIQKKDEMNPSYLLLVPIIINAMVGVMSGGRSSLFNVFIFIILYLIYLNYNKVLVGQDLKKILVIASAAPIVILGGLAAQVLRPLIRANLDIDSDLYWDLVIQNINIFNPDNPLLNTAYFGITELLHRLSALQEKFLILGNHAINDPSLTFNFVSTFQRVINDLLPGSLFLDQININQVFHHIYFNEYINYASHMFGLQGTLYLYFGYYIPAFIIFFLGILYRFQEETINYLLRQSPSFVVMFTFFINDFLENGSFERVIPLDLVRPLTTFILIIIAVKILYVLFPEKK